MMTDEIIDTAQYIAGEIYDYLFKNGRLVSSLSQNDENTIANIVEKEIRGLLDGDKEQQ